MFRLMINQDKMEAFYLEIMHQIAYIDLETMEIKIKPSKFFGAHFTYNSLQVEL